MRVWGTHFSYTGRDRSGVEYNLRPDIGTKSHLGLPPAPVHRMVSPPVIEHRDPWRSKYRQEQKSSYYAMREELKLERVEAV
jgi:hypothetical protein